jgi:UDP-glucuronate 4-epimerase
MLRQLWTKQTSMVDSKPNVLITGIAGFIGYHLAKKLSHIGYNVYGIDNLNDYYTVQLKLDRLKDLGIGPGEGNNVWTSNENNSIHFRKADLAIESDSKNIFSENVFDAVVHLAAQPGVRKSITHPDIYFKSNLTATFNLLEQVKSTPDTRLLMASSSSVYGHSENTPYEEDHNTDKPVSLYAATKKSTEILAHYYAHQYKIDTSLLRFFTVYGPWGRPDMAVYGFFNKIMNDEVIKVFNNGELRRDFTYIDDIVDNLALLLNHRLETSSEKEDFSYEIYNIGNQSPVKLMDFISLIEEITNKTAQKELLPMQPGDVFETYADSSKIKKLLNFDYNTPLKNGLTSFYEWYMNYHGQKTKAIQSHE